MLGVFSKLLDLNQREIDRLSKAVAKVNELEVKTKKLKDADFAKHTDNFKKRLEKGETLEDLLPEAFALAREAANRTIGMRPFNVQVMAAAALFEGKVAEQKTGEGKTLSAVLPLYLRALEGKGVHLVTVNDYLARRDAGWNAPIFELLGMSVGVIAQEMKSYRYDSKFSDTSHGDERLEHLKPVDRQEAYRADVTYGTNNEFGFDYLRDNMVQRLEDMVQRGHYFAIVDEVDSVLIDEARTPLIISAPDTDPTDRYYRFAELIEKLNTDTDFTIDEKSKSASLTEHGITRVEKLMGVDNLYEKDFEAIHHIENALRAKTLFLRDRDYIVKDDQVVIVDEFTGRLMVGRRWSDGMHQAVEAKEGVKIQQESKTLATISFQNYFRMYEHLAGMTGTAATEAEEFKKIYGLDVVVVPTHKPMIRKDHGDVIYKNLRAKYGAIVKEIEKKHAGGQAVLVGTTSIEKNEIITTYLKKKKIPHNVLNAKNHEREAMIIADAGKPGAVTVATNMAGRGVDIILGGAPPALSEETQNSKLKTQKEMVRWKEEHEKVIKAGGLHVIGTERHESRRIDNQLRGRSGRQGDPGSSRFFLSLEDDLMRIFGGAQIQSLMDRLKVPEDQPIENKLISRAVEQAQVKVEGFNFDIRKNLVEYDDVANQQRDIIYKLRRRVLESNDLKKEVLEKLEHQIDRILLLATKPGSNKIDRERVLVGLMDIIPFDETSKGNIKTQISKLKTPDRVKDLVYKVIINVRASREKQVGEAVMRQIEKFAYLGSIDHLWIDHLDAIDSLREGVRVRAYGQKDPLVEFKNEAYDMFEGLIDKIDEELSHRIFRIGVAQRPSEIPLEQAQTNIDRVDAIGLADQRSAGQSPALQSSVAGSQPSAVGNQSSVVGGRSSVLGPQTSGELKSEDRKLVSENRQPGSQSRKIGRNDPCWCGSGKKWKKCHYPQLG